MSPEWAAVITSSITLIIALLNRYPPGKKRRKEKSSINTDQDTISTTAFYDEVDKITVTYRNRTFVFILVIGVIGSFSGYTYFAQLEINQDLSQGIVLGSSSINLDSLITTKLNQSSYLKTNEVSELVMEKAGWKLLESSDTEGFKKGCEYRILLTNKDEAFYVDKVDNENLRTWIPEMVYVERRNKTILHYEDTNPSKTESVRVFSRCN